MKFNTKQNQVTVDCNHQGSETFVLDSAMELYTAVVTWSLNDSFYENSNDRLFRLQKLIAENNPLFVAKLAVYARHNMYMRSAPLVLVAELAKIHSGDNLVARVTEKVAARADEITELLACYQLLNKRKGLKKLNHLSKQIQKGLSVSFNRFDEYQFAKYNRDSEIKLRDALFLIHPKAKDEAQQLLFNKIANNKLATPYTWETELSALGQNTLENDLAKKEAFRDKWQELIDSNRLGYMALLRNLRNVIEAGISYDHLQKVCDIIGSAEKVANAKQFPFRYLAAYRELKVAYNRFETQEIPGENSFIGEPGYTGKLLDVLEKAVVHSAANITGFDQHTRVLLACDVSGSMRVPVSPKSKIYLYDIGLMLAMLLQTRCKNVRTGMFGETWKTIKVPESNVLSNVQELDRRAGEVGLATNGNLVIQDLLENGTVMDKVMLFTDCQLWNSNNSTDSIQSLWGRYKQEVAPNARLYLFDLQGYGQSPLRLEENDVYLIAGWSDKIFSVLDAVENGKQAIDEINAIEI